MPPRAILEFIEEMEHALGRADAESATRYLRQDVAYRVGAQPAVVGIQGILDYMAYQNGLVSWDGHTVHGVWEAADSVVIEVTSHFTRRADKRRISFPCTDIYRFRSGLICDWRVFADMSPFFDTSGSDARGANS